jgi:hypothetical protein
MLSLKGPQSLLVDIEPSEEENSHVGFVHECRVLLGMLDVVSVADTVNIMPLLSWIRTHECGGCLCS